MWKFISRMVVAGTLLVGGLSELGATRADDWPMLGRDGSRNGVSAERGAPTAWSIEEREEGRLIREVRGIRWSARLGAMTSSSPVVSGGLVWIGTNNWRPDMQTDGKQHSVLRCFRVSDGQQVFEYVSPHLPLRDQDPGWLGLGSSPLIEGDRLWLATNRAEVVCLDIGPLRRGEGPPRELWKLDLIAKFDPFQRMPTMGPARPCSIGASWNGRLFVTINNGVELANESPPKPDAPSLVCLNKDTGELLWKDNSPGANILLTQFASPTLAEIAGKMQVIVPQSDGWVRGFDPASGEKLWEFDVNLKASVYLSHNGRSTRNCLVGNAVVFDGRVYLASGGDAEQGPGTGRLVCIDPTKRGDVSSELAVDANDQPLPRRRVQAVDLKAGEKAIPNPNSALVWDFLQCGQSYEQIMHRTMSSVAVAKGLVIVPDMDGAVHCLDAKTGQHHWGFDVLAGTWCSPLIVEDKVYVANEDGDVVIFRLTSEPHEPLARIAMDSPIYSSPVFANGTLYVACQHQLFAITGDKEAEANEPVVSGHWPQWRGPNRDNISTDTELMKEWPAAGPPLRWRVQGLGEGISPVSIAGGRVFALSQFETTDYIRAVHERTGQQLWTAAIGSSLRQSPLMRWLTQRPPTVDGERLYAISLLGELACLRTADGTELWRQHYATAFGGQRGVFGFSDCPLVADDKLICTPAGVEASIVALDKKTGRLLWKCAVSDVGRAAYGNGVVTTIEGQRQFITFLEKTLVGVAVEDGKLLWRYDGIVDQFIHPHTPLIRDRSIVCINTTNPGGMKRLELQLRDGTFVVTEAAATKSSHFARYQDDTVLWNDRLYEPSNGIFSCFNGKNGSVVWQQRMGPTFATTFADGHYYFHADDGRMRLVEPAETEPRVKSEFVLPDHKNSLGTTTPIVTGGRLFVREDDQLFCYDVRAEAAKLPASVPLQVVLTAPDAKLRADLHERTLRSVFVPTPNDLVAKMLELAAVKQSDVVFDLGSGDGRIVISAAKKFGCKAVGYELDAELVATSRTKAQQAGVEPLVTFEHKDLFTADLSNADVLAVYLLPQQLTKLLPQLEKMKPGSRVVSHQFEIPGFPADKTLRIRSAEDGQEHAVHLWTLPLPKPLHRIVWQNIHIYHTAFSPDGRWFLGGGDTNAARIWDVASGKQLVEIPVPIAHFTPDGKQLVGHNQSQIIFVFDAESGREVRRWETPSPIVSIAVAPNGKQVVSGHADKVLRLWEFATGHEVRKLEGHTELATAVFSPDSQRVLSASRDKSIRLWNAESGQLLRTFADLQSAIPIPANDLIVQAFFLPNGQQIAGYAWGTEKPLLVWNAESGEVVRKFDLGANHHKDVAISPDGRWFLTGHADRTLRVRDLMTGTEVRRWEMQGVYVPRALNFSPDSRLVLAGSHRGLINLWQFQKAP